MEKDEQIGRTAYQVDSRKINRKAEWYTKGIK